MMRVPQIDRWLQDLRAYRRVALDTNVGIYALEDVVPYKELAQHVLNLMERGYMTGLVSTVVEAEVLVKPLREQDQSTLEKAELFFRDSPNLVLRSLDRTIAKRAAMVRAANTRILLPDAVIVATALEEQCDVIIGNDSVIASRALGIPYLYLDDYIS